MFGSYSDSLGVGSSALVRSQSAWLVSAARYSLAVHLSLFLFFFWRCTHRVWTPLSSTWPLRAGCRHAPVSKSTYATSLFFLSCKREAFERRSRSRGMFWICQDKKKHFRLCFVDQETFSPWDNEKAEISEPRLVCFFPRTVIPGRFLLFLYCFNLMQRLN